MPKTPASKNPLPDPATDIVLCRASPGLFPWIEPGTLLFAHPEPGGAASFYLSYRYDPSGPLVIRPFSSTLDAVAFIRGLAGPGLDRMPEPELDRIRKYFPGWFDPVERADRDTAGDSKNIMTPG